MKELETGLFEGIPNEEYHQGPGWGLTYSRSDLVLAKDYSPAHVQAREEFKETPATIFGSAAHMACLEPEIFADHYSVIPDGLNLRTKDGKAFKAMVEKKGKICLSSTDGEKIFAMQKKLISHPTAKKYLHGGQFEVSGFFRDPDYGLPCKVRFDYYRPDILTIIDYKTARDPRVRPFTSAAYNSRYHVQAAWYPLGLSCIDEGAQFFDITFIFIVQEKEPPYEIMIYEAEDNFKEEGLRFCDSALKIIKECEDTGSWPGYDPTITPLELPEWVLRQHDRGIYE